MSITLNSTLQAAQDGQTHHPIIEVKTAPIIADIPFSGEYLTEESLNESVSNTITLANGRIITVYKFNSSYFKFVYTDIDRQEFNFVSLNINADLDSGVGLFWTMEASITELADGNVGMIYTYEDTDTIYMRWAKISDTGIMISTGAISSIDKVDGEYKSPYVIKLDDDSYLLGYFDDVTIEPVSGGTYTGTTNSEYEIVITQAGDETTAFFYWRKDGGAWSAEIQCTGAAQALSDGVTIQFVSGAYFVGMEFKISCRPETYAKGYASVTTNPDPLSTVTIGAKTYTHQTPPLVGGGSPNDVAIDIYAYEITMQNLVCAINDETYEGTGEGIRYGTGTTANAQVSAVRSLAPSQFSMVITAKTAGVAGNSIVLTFPTGYTVSAMSGGADSSVGDCQTSTSTTIRKRTSADFETWSVETIVTIGNIVANRKENLSLIQLANNDVWVLFDNYDNWFWSNCYYSVSTDRGLNFGNATALTSYDSALASGKHPEAVQKAGDTIHIAFHEERGALHLNDETTGWPGGLSTFTTMHVYNGKIYGIATYNFSGDRYFIAVVEVDIATWRITNSWTTTSTPAFHSFFAEINCWPNALRHGGKYVVVGSAMTTDYPVVAVLNIDTNVIRHFYFVDNDIYGIVKNVDWTPSTLEFLGVQYDERTISFCVIDEVNDLLYIIMFGGHAYNIGIEVISIDLTQLAIPGEAWQTVRVYSNEGVISNEEAASIRNGDFQIYPEYHKAILSIKSTVSNWPGRLIIFDTSGLYWSIYHDVTGSVGSQIPYHGFHRVEYDGSNVWGTFEYNVLYGEGSRKGVCRYNIGSGKAVYYEPVLTFQVDDYALYGLWLTDDNKLIMASITYGIIIYDINTNEWSLYSNDTVPGLTPTGYDYFFGVTYDESSDMVFGCAPYNPQAGGGSFIAGFSLYGFLRHPEYIVGEYISSWSFGAANDLVIGYMDSDCSITLDPSDNGIFAFWTRQDQDEFSIKWGKETPEFNITPYIVRSSPIILKWSIDGTPNSINFTVSHGHLFDPFNAASVWRNYVKKGYKIIIRIGELISGYEYWQNQGTFVIMERSVVTFERGKYPTMEIKGEDKRAIWEEMEIFVGTDYTAGQTPEYILSQLIENEAGEDLADIDIPTFDNTTTLYHQWIETTITEIIEQIVGRYGYFAKITVDDDFTCKKISDQNNVDHIYSNANQIVTYTPDDTFSDYTNKIIVVCEGNEYQENIKYEDTVIKTLTGTLGYWGQKSKKPIWFDEEQKKQFVPIDSDHLNKSLRVIESAKAGIMFKLAGNVKEDIIEWDTENRYCILRLEAPDLRPALIFAVTGYIAALTDDSWIGRVIQASLFAIVVDILASIVTYNYQIHGYPVGENKISWQAIAEDEELQIEIGKEVIREIEEPLAYYIDEAQIVANFEMLVTKLQRKRLKITKIAHLQDEAGDTIRFKHPYSGRDMDMFVTNLTRTIKMPEKPDGSGTMEDEIEGWVIT